MIALIRGVIAADMGSCEEAVMYRQPSPGRATVLALGKAFPHQLVMQDYLVDSYFRDIRCNDLELKKKLAHLCNCDPPPTSYYHSPLKQLPVATKHLSKIHTE